MSIWCSKEFVLSCDVDLDMKVYVGSLQLRALDGLRPENRECYISLQLADGGIPLHPFARSTGLCYASGSKLVWDEWIAIPIKIRDLTDRSQLIIKIWGVGNECFGGACVRAFDKHLSLRRGHMPLILWRRAAEVAQIGASADLSGETPLSLLVRPDRSRSLFKFLEQFSLDRAKERGVRDALARDGRVGSDPAAAVQVTNVDVPSTPWTDRMLALQLQRELLAAQEQADATANEPRLEAQADVGGASGSATESRTPLADILLLGTLALHFPLFPYPILFEDAIYTCGGPGEAGAPSGLTVADGAGSGHPLQARMPPLIMQPTMAGAAMLSGDGLNGESAGRAYWGEQLMVIWDPEDDAGTDNPSDAKYHKMVRANSQGPDASTIKPTRAELAKIQAIISAPDPTGTGAKPSQESADLLWRLRYSLTGNKRALVKFAQIVDWNDEQEANEAAQLLASWTPIDTEDALRLLCPEFSHPIPRQHAVTSLRRTTDDELLLYLLQLVQALRYEPHLLAAVSGHAHGHSHRSGLQGNAEAVSATAKSTSLLRTGDGLHPTASRASEVLAASPLADLLVERACTSAEVAIYLHWFLVVAMDDTNQDSARLFAAVHNAFNAALQCTASGRTIADVRDAQVAMLQQLSRAREDATSSKKDSVKAKIDKLNQLLSPEGPYPELISMSRPLPLPCAPGISVAGIIPGGCHMFKSALYPTVVTFKVHPTARLDWASPVPGAGVCGLTVSSAARRAAQAYKAQHQGVAVSSAPVAGRTPVMLFADAPGSVGSLAASTQSGLPDAVAAACTAAGENPATYRVIFKQGDDLRQDQLIIQLLRIFDAQLRRVGLDVRLTPYSVIATGKEAGLMEMVLGSLPVSAVLENATYARTGNPVQAYLREKNADERSEYGIAPDVMDTYVKSCAGYSAITYLLGIGDRHLDNIMIASDGRLFHLDFGFIFGKDPKPLPPPMRITKEMIDGMGGPASSNYTRFKAVTCQTYNILRRHASLITVLLTLMRDAGIPDLHTGAEASTVIAKLHDKFRVDVDDEAADAAMLDLLDTSVSALAPAFFEVLHKIRVAMR